MPDPGDFAALVDEGLGIDVEARWGAGFLPGRYLPGEPSWTWTEVARPYLDSAGTLLDMGTGDGSELLTLVPLPRLAIAYEEWLPTVPAAAATLRPHGVRVVVCLGSDDNTAPRRSRPRLPFADRSFDVITNRHEAFDAADVHRLLRPGGGFVTQQVGADEEASVRTLLGLTRRSDLWDLDTARAQLAAAGLVVVDGAEERVASRFTDLAALIGYVRSVPWSVPEFDPVGMRETLRTLHDRCLRDGGVDVVSHRFWVAARRVRIRGWAGQNPRMGARVRDMTASSQPEQPASHVEPELPRIRPALDAIPSYLPGKPPPSRPGLTTYKLSSNENPYPPLPGVIEAATRAAQRINRYPDMGATALYAAIAKRFDAPEDDLAAGTGSVAILYHLLQATCADGDEVVYAWRSFEAYPIAVPLTGAASVQVPVTPDGRHDLTAMADAITDRTRVVIVCTPNNPTGPSVHRDELLGFLDRVPSRVLVVIDEAYREFVRDPDTVDAVELYRGRDNVAVLRTFSKAYGLAGLRIGFAIAPQRIADAIRKAVLPFGISQIAQDAAVASLDAEDALLERVDALVNERTRVLNALRAQGWEVPESQANFVWLPLGDRTLEFAAAGAGAGIMVRPFAGDGARVTIGEVAANDVFLRVADEWRASGR